MKLRSVIWVVTVFLITIGCSTLVYADSQLAGLGGLLDKVKKGAEDTIKKTIEDAIPSTNPQPIEPRKDQPRTEEVVNKPQTNANQATNADIGNIPLANPPIVNYQFTKLVDFDSKSLSTTFSGIGNGVNFSKFKLNRDGAVAFIAFDIKTKSTGVYMADRGQLTTIASSTNGDFFEAKSFSMSLGFNNNGKVAFIAEKIKGGDAIFLAESGKQPVKVLDLVGSGATLISLSDEDVIYFRGGVASSGTVENGTFIFSKGKATKLPDGYAAEAIDPSGKVLVTKAASNTNIMYWLDGKFQSIYSDNNNYRMGFERFYSDYMHYRQLPINKNGSFVLPSFKNRTGSDAQKLSLVSNGQVTTISEQDDNFHAFKQKIAISDNNNIAFAAKVYSSSKPKTLPGEYLFRYVNGQLESLGIGDGFQLFINDSGMVVFDAGNRQGIFYGPDPFKHKVIVNSDKIFGLAISSLWPLGLTNSGSVIFLVKSGPSKTLIVRADPL